jgi:hypothetical protein
MDTGAEMGISTAGAAFLLWLFVFAGSPITLGAQVIGIKLVNGKDGHPISAKCVNVWVGDRRKEAMAIPTNTNGVARVQLATSGTGENLTPWNGCGDFGILNPVVEYADVIAVNVGYVLCQQHGSDYSWLATTRFSTKKIIAEGIVMPNTCGKATATPMPGQVVIFVRPLNFWEQLKQ